MGILARDLQVLIMTLPISGAGLWPARGSQPRSFLFSLLRSGRQRLEARVRVEGVEIGVAGQFLAVFS